MSSNNTTWGRKILATSYPRMCISTSIYTTTTLTLFLGEGWSQPLRIRVSAYPLQTTLTLFLGEGWSQYPRIHFKLQLHYFQGRGGRSHFVSAYPRIRVSTAHYNYIISRGGVVPATSYPRIRTPRVRNFDVTGYSAVTPTFDLFCTTILNTYSDLKVHALHYANELLVRVSFPFKNFCKLAQHAEAIRKHCLGKK